MALRLPEYVLNEPMKRINFITKLATAILLFTIIAVAIFFRFYRLQALPPDLWVDVALNGNSALESLQTGLYKTIYPPEYCAREGMIMWLDALSINFSGITTLALKIPTAFFGVLTVFGIYLLSRQLFKNKNGVALWASFFCAVSFWHVSISRIGFRAALMPFFLVFAFYFLWRAFGEKRIRWAIAAGIFFGLGFYTYTPFAAALPLLFCVLALWLIIFWQDKKRFFWIVGALLSIIFLAVLPLAVHLLKNPEMIGGRNSEISVFSASSLIIEAGISLVLHLGMFNIAGDKDWRHNIPGSPQLFFPVGVLFVVGIVICVVSIRKMLKIKKIDHESVACGALLLWLFFLLLPGALTKIAIPHALRAIGAFPATMILAGLGMEKVGRWIKPRFHPSTAVGLAAIFAVICFLDCHYRYFTVWASSPELPFAYTSQFAQLGKATSQVHNLGYRTMVIANIDGITVPYPNGIPIPAQSVQYMEAVDCYRKTGRTGIKTCQPYSEYILLNQIRDIKINGKTAVFPMVDFDIVFEWLKEAYPTGKIKTINTIRYYEIESR